MALGLANCLRRPSSSASRARPCGRNASSCGRTGTACRLRARHDDGDDRGNRAKDSVSARVGDRGWRARRCPKSTAFSSEDVRITIGGWWIWVAPRAREAARRTWRRDRRGRAEPEFVLPIIQRRYRHLGVLQPADARLPQEVDDVRSVGPVGGNARVQGTEQNRPAEARGCHVVVRADIMGA